jgi:hypothetical protein
MMKNIEFHCWHPRLPCRAFSALLISLWIFLPDFARGDEKSAQREDSQFNIYIAGKEAGKERYTILTSAVSISSSSTLEFQQPGKKGGKVRIETQLTADSRFLPKSYQLKSDIDGKKATVVGEFTENQVMFQTNENGNIRKSGLMVGDKYLILDTNIFHHFIFIARAFDLNDRNKSQSFEVIVPQELDRGVLRVSNLGIEKTSVRGKEKELYHLKADSGQLQIDLWIDSQKILHKISIPTKKVEVVRIN